MSRSPAYFAVRTMRALEVLAFTPATAPQLAAALGIDPRTARRLLSQLQRDGWLSYSDEWPRLYAPTLRLVALAAQIGARAPLAVLTAPVLEQLHGDTGLDAALVIPSYDATVCIVRCFGERAIQPPLGVAAPAHCTAAGKVLLAHRDAWRRSIFAALPLAACTQRTITDAQVLERELARVRLDGYAIEDGEHIDGHRRVAAPVVIPDGQVLAAIALTASDAVALGGLSKVVVNAGSEASESLRRGASQYPLQRGLVYRLLASYGLAPIDAYIS